MDDELCGQVWYGPLLVETAKRRVLLILWPIDRTQHMAMNLETGELDDFYTNNLDIDTNWTRL